MASLSVPSADFAFNLFRAATEPGKNALLSPVSVSLTLGMAYVGADGSTAAQIREKLFKGVRKSQIHKAMADVVSVLNDPESGWQLHMANHLYAQDRYTLQRKFYKILRKYYESRLQIVDFKNNTEQVRRQINRFVDQITHGRSKDILGPGVLTSDTELVLVNAIYFKGDWCHKFHEENTREAIFYSTDGMETKVQMMHQFTSDYYYLLYQENEDMQILGMPYIGNLSAMFIFLPKDRYGLEDLEKKLNGKMLLQLIGSTQFENVIVDIPKFSLEQSLSLKWALADLGIDDMFVPEVADFSKITGTKDLHVSAVIHHAIFEVTENGTEATAVGGHFLSGNFAPPLKQFNANHSFMFAIVCRQTRSLLFIGRFTNLR